MWERFLADIVAVDSWKRLISPVEPHCRNGSRPLLRLEKILLLSVHQHWFDLRAAAAGYAIYDSEAMRRSVGIELSAADWMRQIRTWGLTAK
jgi:IS5 family transposase